MKTLALCLSSLLVMLLWGALQSAPAAPLETSTVTVRIIDATDGSPVEGATVIARRFFHNGDIMTQRSLLTWEPKESVRYTSDAEGLVHVEALDKSLGILAIDGSGESERVGLLSLYGRQLFQKNIHRIQLRLTKQLDIEVVDTAGAPQPDVALLFGSTSNYRSSHSDRYWVTDSAGRIRLNAANVLLPPVLLESPLPLFVRAEALGTEALARFSVEELPTKPLQLVVDAGAQVIVRPVDVDGKPIVDESLFLQFHTFTDEDRGREWISRMASTGTWTVGSVPPSAELHLVGFQGPESLRMEVRATAPAKVGESVVIDLVFGPPRWVLKGRLLDASGDPIANASFDGSMGSAGYGPGKTDAKGRFTLRLGMGYAKREGDEHRLSVYVRGTGVLEGGSGESRLIPEGEGEKSVELGDISLLVDR